MEPPPLPKVRFATLQTSDLSRGLDLPTPGQVTQTTVYNPALRHVESQLANDADLVNNVASVLRVVPFPVQSWQRPLPQVSATALRPLSAAIHRLAPDVVTHQQTGNTPPATPPVPGGVMQQQQQQLRQQQPQQVPEQQQQQQQHGRQDIKRLHFATPPPGQHPPQQPARTPQPQPQQQYTANGQLSEHMYALAPPGTAATQKRPLAQESEQRTIKRQRMYSEYEGDKRAVPLSPQQVADKSSAVFKRFVAEARQYCEVHLQVGSHEELKSMPWVKQEDIRLVAKEVQILKRADALKLVGTKDLKDVLAVLTHHIALGGTQLIHDDANEMSDSYQTAALCLESMITSLSIISTAGIPNEVVEEELLVKVVEAAKYHLQYNILAMYDAGFRAKYRPNKVTGPIPANARSRQPSVSRSQQKTTENVLGRLEKALELLSDMFAVVKAPTEPMIPLVRAVLHSLLVDSLKTLQLKSVGFLVSVFQHNLEMRPTVLDMVLAELLSTPPSSKLVPHLYLAVDDVHVQMHTALLMQLIQVSADVPWSGNLAAVLDSSKPCHEIMFRVCHHLFDKLPTARAQKADSAVDFKAFVEEFLKDLLDLQCLPDWPAANQFLRWFVTLVKKEKGMGHSDAAVKSMAIDFLGLIVQRLCKDAKLVEDEAPKVTALLEDEVEVAGLEADEKSALEVDQQLLFVLLSHQARQSSKLSGSARHFAECMFLTEQLKQLEKENNLTDEVFKQVMQFLRGVHERHTAGVVEERLVPDQPTILQVTRALMQHSQLGKARVSMLCWLAEAGDRSKQDANAAVARARAIKKLGVAIEEDLRVLGLEEVRAGVKGALQDDSVMVREAAVDLIGKYISSSPDLAELYFDVVTTATTDMGLSVRKRAIKILWECCVKVEDFPRLLDACVHIIYRAADNDASIKTMVTRICSQLWFNPGTSIDGGTEVHAARPAAQRAKQLAEVANFLLNLNNRRLPFATDHPLVLIIKQVVGQEGKPEFADARAGAREVAEALLQMLLAAEGGTDPSAGFPVLLALHALSMAMPTLLVPAQKPDKFVSTLAPYLKESCSGSADEKRLIFERLTCILAIINKVSGVLPRLDNDLLNAMCKELFTELINKCGSIMVVMLACQTVSTLTRFSSYFKGIIRYIGSAVTQFAMHVEHSGLKNGNLKFAARGILLIGYLCRYGADAIDQAAAEATAGRKAGTTVEKCLELVLKAWKHKDSEKDPAGGRKLMEDCLQALGMMFISRPRMLLERAEVMDILLGSLSTDSPMNLKQKALLNLVELVKAEEDQLVAGQQKQQANNTAAAQGEIPIEKVTQLATQNGEGDSLGMSSGIVQMVLQNVLQLMQDVGTNPSAPAADMHIAVRRTALEFVEAVLKGGQCAPWKAIASLVAAVTDPCEQISAKALATLKLATERYAEFASAQLAPGIEATYKFQASLNPATPGIPSANALQGLQKMYQQVAGPDNTKTKQLRNNLLSSLVKLFDEAGNLVAGIKTGIKGSGAYKADVQRLSFSAHVLANLRYKRADEPLFLIYHINQVLSRRSEGVLSDLQKLLAEKKLINPDDEDTTNNQQAPQRNNPDDAPGPQTHTSRHMQASNNNTPSRRHENTAQNVLQNGNASEAPEAATAGNGAVTGRIRVKTEDELDGRGGGVGVKVEDGGNATSTAEGPAASHGAGQAAAAGANGVEAPASQPQPRLEDMTDEQLHDVLVVKAAAAVASLLVLKQYIKAAYYLTDERIAAFSPNNAERRKQEEKQVVTKRSDLRAFDLDAVDLNAYQEGMEVAVRLYHTLKGLMENDASNYREQALIDEYNANQAEGGEQETEGGDMNQGLLLYSMEGKRGRGRGRGTRGGRGRGTAGRARSTNKRGRGAAAEDSGEDSPVPVIRRRAAVAAN